MNARGAEQADRYFRMVNASRRVGFKTPSNMPTPDRVCTAMVAFQDEDFASTYVRVERDTGKVIHKHSGDLVGVLDDLTATSAATGETVTGKNRKAVLTALARVHNAHITRARQS